MLKTKTDSIDFDQLTVIRDKYNRIDADTGINHGRIVYYDPATSKYYKLFHPEYVRRKNFELAIECDFYRELAPALVELIYDTNDLLVGYVCTEGTVISDDESLHKMIPAHFTYALNRAIRRTKMFYYDYVPPNIVLMEDGRLSLIDLESVYELKDFFVMKRHRAIIKPQFLYDIVYEMWLDTER